ncbi:protein translocase subunit SecD [Shewanella maritima]|uniref:protein translocase subunit SecD n=1 Tax=Shewanella maritima TaxID=2520507 RepID=UPI0037363350
MKKSTRRSNPNRLAVWKYLVLLFTLIIMSLSALPSWYGEHGAVHIKQDANTSIDAVSISDTLSQAGIPVLYVKQQEDHTVVALADSQLQSQARAELSKHFPAESQLTLAMEPAAPAWLTDLGFKPIKQGLDLRGGVQFLLEVDMEPVYQAHRQSVIDSVRSEFRTVRGQQQDNGVRITVTESNRADVISFIKQQFPEWQLRHQGSRLLLSQTDEHIDSLRQLTVTQNLQIMRSRIEHLGITEASVQRQGANRIRIELPGVQDPAAAKDVIGATASLSFHGMNNRQGLGAIELPFHQEQVAVDRREVLGGEHIIDARASIGETSMPEVNIVLDSAGGRKMANFSRDNVGQPMATVYHEYATANDGSNVQQSSIISIANIDTQLGSRFRITGVGTLPQAQELALLLRAGSLTAPVTIVEERTIGPSLGAENVKNGFAALGLGLAITFTFIGLWYRRLGWVANAALLFNLISLLGLIALIPGAVLTLPGIAGLVLTVGMAVDTNVLIFERIREKMAEGRSFAQAINTGFESAFSSIWDANLTTMIVAIALYSIGNGPVQGFALTLGLGLLTSMFTGIFASRAMINLIWGRDNRREVKI